MQIIIFGAQGYALGAYDAIRALCPNRQILCFMVSVKGYNANTLRGLPVRELEDFVEGVSSVEKTKFEILIATPDNVQLEIEELLNQKGIYNHQRLTSDRWGEMMKLYYAKTGYFQPLATLPIGCVPSSCAIYMAKFHKDKELSCPPTLYDFVHPIQVGAAKTDIRVAELTDNVGENISERNGNYSELTGLYWIWKNVLYSDLNSEIQDMEYYGFAQYRRMLKLSEDDYLRLRGNDVDVVLPYPLLYEPNIHAHHERYTKEIDWKTLLTALQELQPEYANVFSKVLEQRFMFNYNVILAKKTVLSDYCEWLFPILARVEELSIPKGNERSDRYIGYMGEILETLYFMKNKDTLNIVVTECEMFI